MPINCPVNMAGVVYAITVPAPGAPGIIAANGLALGGQNSIPVEARLFVRLGDWTLLATPPPPGATDPGVRSVPVNAGIWCADNVPVPALTGASGGSGMGGGVAMTMFAYAFDNLGVQTGAVDINLFFGQETAGTKCPGCGPGSGMSAPNIILVASVLSSVSVLAVTIPDGPDAGTFEAHLVAPLRWRLRAARAVELHVCPTRGLVLRHGVHEVVAVVEHHPFSAAFPGGLLEADDEVVVVIA
jgi:hypothetical protein